MFKLIDSFQNEWILDELNPEDFLNEQPEIDIFDEDLVDPNFDDHMMSEMMSIQNALDNESPEDLQLVILQNYIQNYSPQIEDIEDDNILNLNKIDKINLSHFLTKFEFNGIDFSKIIDSINWNLQMSDIVLSFSGKKPSGKKEHLDKDLLEMVNLVDNKKINNFHRDNFLKEKIRKSFI